jgi:hypothetical protein
MLAFLKRIWGAVAGLFLPVLGKARGSQGLATGLRWTIHLVLLAAALIGLYFLNKVGSFPDLVKPSAFPAVRDFWLPILGLLLYGLVWLGWWLWKLLTPEEEVSDFPDIDAAWDQAMQALGRNGIAPADAPLFLVLGRPEGSHAAFFQAAQLTLTVRAPQEANAPLYVGANREGIYVTCAGASLLGRQAAQLASRTDSALDRTDGSVARSDLEVTEGEGEDLSKTLIPGAREAGESPGIVAVLRQAQRAGRDPSQLTGEERREIRLLMKKDKAPPSLLKNPVEVEYHVARLAHLCRLIARDRHPYCPINGILVLIPFAGLDTDQDALDTGEVCQRDLAVIRRVLRVQCPTFTLLCDLETAPGFREFAACFSDREKRERVGQSFPLAPALQNSSTGTGNGEAFKGVLDSLARWVCTTVVRKWAYKHFQTEEPGQADFAAVTRRNARLFLFLEQMRAAQDRLGAILTRLPDPEGDGPPLIGGCYLAGTGPDAANEQAFVAGAVRLLTREQNYVSWTREALAEDARCQGLVGKVYLALGLVVLAAVGAAVWRFWPK